MPVIPHRFGSAFADAMLRHCGALYMLSSVLLIGELAVCGLSECDLILMTTDSRSANTVAGKRASCRQ